MTSLILCCFEKFLAYTLFLPSFIAVRRQMAELNWGAFCPSIHLFGGIQDPLQNRVKENSYGFRQIKGAKILIVPSFGIKFDDFTVTLLLIVLSSVFYKLILILFYSIPKVVSVEYHLHG